MGVEKGYKAISMIKVYQTKFGKESNCFSACLASILELKIEDVPEFKEGHGVWYQKYRRWLQQFGLDLLAVRGWEGEAEEFCPDVYAIVSGVSPRGLKHSVVYKGREMVHDPHPEGGGVKEISDWIYVVSQEVRIK